MVAFSYALITSFATIIGGVLPIYTKLKDLDQKYLIGFASGTMITIALVNMLPEAGLSNGFLVLAGFFTVYLLEKLVQLNSPDFGPHHDEHGTHTLGPVSMIGISLESLIDGVAIAVGYTLAPSLGLTIALGVLVHELPRGFSTTVIMKSAGYGLKLVFLALAVDAFFTPLGVLLSGFFSQENLAGILAFTAGTFIYVGAVDLLPTAHQKLNLRVIGSVLLGVGAIVLVSSLVKI